MFERIAPSEEQKDAEAREGRSPDQIASLRLAAVLMLIESFLTIAVVIAFPIAAPRAVLGVVIRLVLAYYLYKLRPRAEALALGLTILAGIVALLGLVGASFALPNLLNTIPAVGAVGAFLLLLLGDPPREKRVAAVVLFGILVCLPALVLLGLRVAGVVSATHG
jgi:hypothetical protein